MVDENSSADTSYFLHNMKTTRQAEQVGSEAPEAPEFSNSFTH